MSGGAFISLDVSTTSKVFVNALGELRPPFIYS